MKVLTIRQPWAWAIINIGKDVENRTWHTDYRGELLIHSSKRPPSSVEMLEFGEFMVERGLTNYLNRLERERVTLNWIEEQCICGAIIGKVRLLGCNASSKSGWGVGPWHWLLTDPEPLEPLYMPGKLGLWDWADLVERLRARDEGAGR